MSPVQAALAAQPPPRQRGYASPVLRNLHRPVERRAAREARIYDRDGRRRRRSEAIVNVARGVL